MGLQRVATRDNRNKPENALFVGDNRASGAGAGARDGDGNARYNADVVDDSAAEGGGLAALRKRVGRACETDHQEGTAQQACPATSSHIHVMLRLLLTRTTTARDRRNFAA